MHVQNCQEMFSLSNCSYATNTSVRFWHKHTLHKPQIKLKSESKRFLKMTCKTSVCNLSFKNKFKFPNPDWFWLYVCKQLWTNQIQAWIGTSARFKTLTNHNQRVSVNLAGAQSKLYKCLSFLKEKTAKKINYIFNSKSWIVSCLTSKW